MEEKDSLNLIVFCYNIRNLIDLRVLDRTTGINFMGFIANIFDKQKFENQ